MLGRALAARRLARGRWRTVREAAGGISWLFSGQAMSACPGRGYRAAAIASTALRAVAAQNHGQRFQGLLAFERISAQAQGFQRESAPEEHAVVLFAEDHVGDSQRGPRSEKMHHPSADDFRAVGQSKELLLGERLDAETFEDREGNHRIKMPPESIRNSMRRVTSGFAGLPTSTSRTVKPMTMPSFDYCSPAWKEGEYGLCRARC